MPSTFAGVNQKLKDMLNQETIIWASIVVFLAVVLIVKTISELSKDKKSHHIIEFGSEEDIFYCPGDIKYHTEKDK